MKRRLRVALLIETSNSYARELLQGVERYLQEHESWSVYLPELRRGERPAAWLGRWDGDGILARIENREIARAVACTGLPVVDMSSGRLLPEIPWVETDDLAFAQVGVEHYLERGFRRLAFCGDNRFAWSVRRERHFLELGRAAGCAAWVYPSARRAPSMSWTRESRLLADWIGRLPRPIGVMAGYDIRGQQLLEVCRDLEIAVPEEVAVLGVDNDPLICGLSMPPMSSVIPDTLRTGRLAAELLDRWMRGRKPGEITHLIPPLGICTRRSTDVLAVEDTEVAASLQFIREYACDGIRVSDVVRNRGLSRRVLESRFVAVLGRTPHEEIVRVKTQRVKTLLRETDLPLRTIARRAGYSSEEYLSVAFKRVEGLTPSDYRRRHGNAAGSPCDTP